jgi:hypothetical protein
MLATRWLYWPERTWEMNNEVCNKKETTGYPQKDAQSSQPPLVYHNRA